MRVFDAIGESASGKLEVTPPAPIMLRRPPLVGTPDKDLLQSELLLELIVVAQEVVPIQTSPADGRSVIETSMRPVPVVLVQPGGKLGGAKPRVVIGASISPLPQRGLDKAFRLAVGARGVGAGEALGEAEVATGAAGAAPAGGRARGGQEPGGGECRRRGGGHRCPQESRCRCGR